MRYMLLVCAGESVEVSPQEGSPEPWVEEVQRRDGSRLRPVSDATTVRLHGGEGVLSDGPFAETKERIAGYDVIECEDLDEAIEVASKHPAAPPRTARRGGRQVSRGARAGGHRRRAPLPRPTPRRDRRSELTEPSLDQASA
jgi:hypothetical protein